MAVPVGTKVHALNVHTRWTDGLNDLEIIAMNVQQGRLLFHVLEGDEVYQRTLQEVVPSYVASVVATDPEVMDRVDSDLLYSDLSREIRAAVFKAQQILAVFEGPREGIGERWKKAADAVGVSVSQLRKKADQYFEHGLVGLVHQNRKVKRTSLSDFDSRTVDVLKKTVAENIGESQVHGRNLRARAKADLREAGAPEPYSKKLGQLLDLLNAGHSAYGSAKTRESVANRPKGAAFRKRNGFFADEVEIDSWETNILIWDLQGVERRAWVVAGICTATKRTWARVTAGHPTGRDVGLLLHDMINPCPVDAKARPWLDVVGIPSTIGINAEPGFLFPHAEVGVIPGLIRLDHGKEGENLHVISIAAQLGIDIEWARPMTPTDKAFIESRFRDLAAFVQILPGHVGKSPDSRGKNAAKGPRLKLWELQLLLDEWLHLSMYIPHRGLQDPTTRGKFFTPMQVFNMSITSHSPIRITPHVNLVYEFLPSVKAVASDDAVSIGGVDYTGPALPLMTAISKGDSKRAGRKLTFHVDDYDRTRIFWHAPGTMQWHVLRARSPENGEVVPAFSEILRQRLIDTKSSPRLTPTKLEEVRTLLIQYVRGFMRARGPGADFGLLVTQLLAAVRDPAPEPTMPLIEAGVGPEFLFEDDEGDDDDLEALVIGEDDWDEVDAP